MTASLFYPFFPRLFLFFRCRLSSSGGVFRTLCAIFFSYAFSLVIFSSVFFGSVSFFLSFCVFEIIRCVCPASFLVTVEPFPVLLEFCTTSSDTSSSSCIVFASLQSYASLLLLVFLLLLWGWFLFPGLLLLLQFRVVAPPLFSPLRLLYPPILRFVCTSSFCIRSSFSVCCGSRCSFQPSSAFFCMLRLQLLLPVFLLVFPHAAASTAPSSFSPRFPLAASPAASRTFAVTPVILLVEGSPDAVPPGSLGSWLSLCLLLLKLCLRFSLLRLRCILSRYALLSFECCYYFMWCFCLVRVSGSLRDVVSRWDKSGFAGASVSLSSQGCLMW